jgi:hypothetical protein
MKTTIAWHVSSAFARNMIDGQSKHNGVFPMMQRCLLVEINEQRNRIGVGEISNEQLARCLTKLKAEGKIERLLWSTPSARNVWVWTADDFL